jgi:hypothetical protein
MRKTLFDLCSRPKDPREELAIVAVVDRRVTLIETWIPKKANARDSRHDVSI